MLSWSHCIVNVIRELFCAEKKCPSLTSSVWLCIVVYIHSCVNKLLNTMVFKDDPKQINYTLGKHCFLKFFKQIYLHDPYQNYLDFEGPLCIHRMLIYLLFLP